MKKSDVLRLRDYLEHIELAIQRIGRYVDGLDRIAFFDGWPAFTSGLVLLQQIVAAGKASTPLNRPRAPIHFDKPHPARR